VLAIWIEAGQQEYEQLHVARCLVSGQKKHEVIYGLISPSKLVVMRS
jgi:hypothetical protein